MLLLLLALAAASASGAFGACGCVIDVMEWVYVEGIARSIDYGGRRVRLLVILDAHIHR